MFHETKKPKRIKSNESNPTENNLEIPYRYNKTITTCSLLWRRIEIKRGGRHSRGQWPRESSNSDTITIFILYYRQQQLSNIGCNTAYTLRRAWFRRLRELTWGLLARADDSNSKKVYFQTADGSLFIWSLLRGSPVQRPLSISDTVCVVCRPTSLRLYNIKDTEKR